MDFVWIAPIQCERFAELENLRGDGSIAFAQRHPMEMDAIISRGPRERANAACALLNVPMCISLDPNGTLAHETHRMAPLSSAVPHYPRASHPTVRYYARDRTDFGLTCSWDDSIALQVRPTPKWIAQTMVHATLTIAQCRLTDDALHQPVIECRLILWYERDVCIIIMPLPWIPFVRFPHGGRALSYRPCAFCGG